MRFAQECLAETKTNKQGAMQMLLVQQPTRLMQHIDMKRFVILQWFAEDTIFFADCPPALLVADSVTKQTGRTTFHEHMDVIVGQGQPEC
jgi:hypothetical protein